MIKSNLISKVISGDESDPKARIAKAAIEEFALRSLDGARIREIAKKSGTNVAAISYHFGGKRELYKSVVAEMSSFFDDAVKPYYEEGDAMILQNDPDAAMRLARKFLIESIRKFSEVKIVSSLCLIMARETASPSEYFKYVYDSIYQRPVQFISGLLIAAAKGKLAKDISIVFAQALWSNVRSYSSKTEAVMKLHSWTELGEAEIKTIDTALKKVLEKTLK